jgi:GTP cyclohydrolase I
MSTAEVEPLTSKELPDCASQADTRGLDVDRVGIQGLKYPIDVLDKKNKIQHTIADITLSVRLAKDFKGTHMSRFVEVLNSVRGEITLRNMPEILAQVQRRLDASESFMEVAFPYYISKRAPVTQIESLMDYSCVFRGSRVGEEFDFVLQVEIPVQSLCPCSKEISDRGAHNQRSNIQVQVRGGEFLWIEDVVEVVEGCASVPLFALLKREDEKWVTENAYDNPKFVEDLVRDCVLGLRGLEGVKWLHVTAVNHESIHNHAAYAEIEWTSQEVPDSESTISPPGTDSSRTFDFGAWLRHSREARGFNQQELANLLEVSNSFISRVESGDKSLSRPSMRKLARIFGLEEEVVLLRAGIPGPEYLQRIANDPEGFLSWVSQR